MRALLIGLVLASGCLTASPAPQPPDDPPSNPPARSARQMFDEDVFPTLTTTCAGCHAVSVSPPTGLGFVGGDATTTYEHVVADRGLTGDFSPAGARILQLPAGHNGVRYSDAEIAKITAWLAREAAERR